MASERLNDIALIHAHQEIVADKEKLIDLFSRMLSRKLLT